MSRPSASSCCWCRWSAVRPIARGSTFRGIDLAPRWAEAEQRIQQAATLDQILAAIAQVSLSLNDSHTLFFPPSRTLAAEYGWETQMIGDTSYVSEVQQQRDAARQGVKPDDAVLLLNGSQPDRGNIPLIVLVDAESASAAAVTPTISGSRPSSPSPPASPCRG